MSVTLSGIRIFVSFVQPWKEEAPAGHAVGNGDTHKTCAILECAGAYAGYPLGDRHVGQAVAGIECQTINTDHAAVVGDSAGFTSGNQELCRFFNDTISG